MDQSYQCCSRYRDVGTLPLPYMLLPIVRQTSAVVTCRYCRVLLTQAPYTR